MMVEAEIMGSVGYPLDMAKFLIPLSSGVLDFGSSKVLQSFKRAGFLFFQVFSILGSFMNVE